MVQVWHWYVNVGTKGRLPQNLTDVATPSSSGEMEEKKKKREEKK